MGRGEQHDRSLAVWRDTPRIPAGHICKCVYPRLCKAVIRLSQLVLSRSARWRGKLHLTEALQSCSYGHIGMTPHWHDPDGHVPMMVI